MKEAEMDALAMPWVNARVVHLLAVHRMMPMEVGDTQEEKFDMDGNNPLMYTQKAKNIGTLLFSHNTSKDREGIFGRAYSCYGTGPSNPGWLPASRPDCAEHIH